MLNPLNHIKNVSKVFAFPKGIGVPPGSLEYTGKHNTLPITIDLISYNSDDIKISRYSEEDMPDVMTQPDHYTWININGVHNTDFMAKIGKRFNIPNLLLEDIMSVNFMPKSEIQDDQVFLTMKMLHKQNEREELLFEQLSFILMDNILISFQEFEGDIFDNIRNRAHVPESRLRQRDPAYLLYLILDTIIDYYLISVNLFSQQINMAEQEIIDKMNENHNSKIMKLKKQGLLYKSNIYPIKEMMLKFMSVENRLVTQTDIKYFKDLQDHILHLVEENKMQTESIKSLMELNSNNINNSINQVMKKLTIISTIFIPLTFIAGLYGMNFEYIPETKLHFGYFYALGFMLIVALYMYFYVKKL